MEGTMSKKCPVCHVPECDKYPSHSPIYRAVIDGDNDLLKKLLSTATYDEVNDIKLTKKSALDQAVKQGDYVATKLLLDHGAKPNFNRKKPTWNKSTLGRAIQSENRDIIKLLIDVGCDPDDVLAIDDEQHIVNTSPYNCWYKIVEYHDLPMFRFLVDYTGKKIGNNDWSRRLLLTACGTDSAEIAMYLIDEGVPIDSVGSNGLTGTFYALAGYYTTTFQLLVDRGANVKQTDCFGLSLLHLAVSVDIGITRQLLDRGIDVNIRDIHNRTPLFYAVRVYPEVVQLLLERGADYNAVDKYGRTAIHMTVLDCNYRYESDYRIIKLLLKQKDINVHQRDYVGITLLHHVAADTERRIVRDILLSPKVNINARDDQGRTPFQFLIKSDFFINIDIFLDFGADTTILNKYKDSLLKHKMSMLMLACHNLKRSIAGFEKDPNIEAVLDNQNVLSPEDTGRFIDDCTSEIKLMKATPLLGKLTYFDFLHAKRRTCIAVASKPEMRNIFVKATHKFQHYSNMLCQKYVSGLRPLNEVEVEALNDAEDNINFLLNYRLPSLVVYKMKNYINIEDMVTLQSMNLFECDDSDDTMECEESS